MDKAYNPQEAEKKWYSFWEEKGYFKPEINHDGKPYTIILPPPNASGKMHTGNVLMIAIEDLLIRWRRMKGDAALWVPGTDHAGFETQITFERELKKQGKSRFNFSRQELYDAIMEFVKTNRHAIEDQIRQMGASVDWSRYTFTLDEQVISTVYDTFKKMVGDGLVYRGEHMVNYCPKCGTTFADLEIDHIERVDTLYYVRYKLVDRQSDEPEYLEVATVRPEPIMVDTHLAVNPKDKKMAKYAGRKLRNPLTDVEMEIIADEFVDPKFGTGLVKLTPAHDKKDYEVAKKYGLPIRSVIDWNGKLNEHAGSYQGLKVLEARKQIVALLEEKGLLNTEKTNKNYKHSVPICYKGGHDIEQLPLPNWFVAVDKKEKSFKKPAYDAVKNGTVKIHPKWREKTYLRWMEEMHDWPISRQIVWGIRIPVWYKVEKGSSNIWVYFLDKEGKLQQGSVDQFLKRGITLEEIEKGLQRLWVLPGGSEPAWKISKEKPTDGDYLPETDTFDTWFSSGQWPLVTLGYPNSADFKKFYPTDVLETGWEILRFWVSRMIMFGLYRAGNVPFKNVYLHGIVRALDGRKMSKSLGNIINPDEYIQEYGVDALRMGLIAGTANGKDFAFPKDRIIAFKHFANKIWNMGRFILMMIEQSSVSITPFEKIDKKLLTEDDKAIVKALQGVIKTVNANLEKFRFADAAEVIYQFMWHEVADKYIEQVKGREDKEVALSVLHHVYISSLKLLHPFMPFVTEEIYQHMPNHGKSIMIEQWPQ